MLKLQHLTKRFGAAPLFTDLCMEVDAPVVLWASSGWGKTTLLRILMGLERPTTGSVEGVGRVAAVFQEDRLCPQLNAVQNVTLVLPGAENQYKEQITSDFQQLGMDTAALQLPARRLSGGQKRRVALLRAAAMEAGITDISQKGRQLVFSFDPHLDAAALLAVCTMACYRSWAQLSAGAAPKLTLYMQPKEEALDAAFGLVEALRLRQQENGAEAHTEETKHEE